jgi:hypothetical protein
MDWAPYARVFIRYVVGLVIGMDAGASLAGDPDVVTLVALAIGAAVEAAYAYAKRNGGAT